MTDSVASPAATGTWSPDPGTATDPIGRLRPGPDDDVGSRRGAAVPAVRAALADRLPLSLRAGALDPAARGALVLAAVAVVAALVAAFFAWQARPVQTGGGGAAQVPVIATAPAPSAAPPDLFPSGAASALAGGPAAEVVVDVAGKVRRPGVVRLPNGSRVVDAVASAGGVLPGVDTSALSLARKVVDGEQILVTGQPATAPPAGIAGTTGPGPAGASTGPGALVNLNTATLEQLDGLPGVGPVLAQRIVEYRQENGGFSSVDQLGDVKGVGPKRAADLKPLVSVR